MGFRQDEQDLQDGYDSRFRKGRCEIHTYSSELTFPSLNILYILSQKPLPS
jgi:hypothetical protein